MQLMYSALAVPIALSVLAIAAGFKRQTSKTREPATKLSPRLAQPQTQPVACEERKASDNTVISCPNCKKTFGRPLVMLNFGAGKNRLVNVCPYCSHVLGTAENEKTSTSDFKIADSDKKHIKNDDVISEFHLLETGITRYL